MRTFKDEQGREWLAERVGRTSGIVTRRVEGAPFPEPADIIRFSCSSDPDQADRETTISAGLLEKMEDGELLAKLQSARKLRRL